ncbi:MAG TPA: aspartate carbamoyltransferase [Candidatus Binatia bacterium]|nr:aspartate carbamoyltransferase [Candidatus Binatia bacterium]
MQHVLSVEQFDNIQLETLFAQSEDLRTQLADPKQRRELVTKHVDRPLCSLFYEESTRTRLSFERAGAAFGMIPIGTENALKFSSAAKGESLEHTIRVLNQYDFGVIVLRHHETGGAARAASVSETPIINAGDGKGEHPTQALLDAYTIFREFGRLDNLRTVIGGDLANGRTARSLAKLLSHYEGNHISFVSMPELQIGEDIKLKLQESGTQFEETTDMYGPLRHANVVYWTRLQKERLENPDAFRSAGFTIDALALAVLPSDSVILHPLPIVDEVAPEVDADPRAQYFPQAGNGFYIRMALIDQILSS